MNKMLQAALWYHKNGFNVIPAKKNKKAYVGWKSFQDTPTSEVQIREWWQKWPNANIAIITGKRSNLTVIDADSEAGRDAVGNYLPENMLIPTVKTPKGWHYYFSHLPSVSNKAKILTDCDIRSEGGYVIAPPSSNGSKKGYAWLDGLRISEVKLNPIPKSLATILEDGSFNAVSDSNIIDCNSSSTARARVSLYNKDFSDDSDGRVTTLDDSLSEGSRDNTLFHLANHLVRGGMPKDNIRYFLRFFASRCNPPFPEKEIEIKIQSAIERSKRRDINLSAEIKDWVLSSSGVFLSSETPFLSSLSSRDEKKAVSKVFSRLVADGIIERVGGRNSMFRKVDNELNVVDIFNVQSEDLDIRYPLDVHELFRTMPRNIIVIAGTQNVGKTAFLLNLASLNMNRGMNIRYFTSEMGELELSNRCKMFEPDIPFSFWKNVEFCDHSSGFSDKIDPDGLNIIDYLEIPDNFWQVGERLKEIYDKLKKGIAVVALQKKFGTELGRGAEFSLEKPRLYITLEANPPEGNIARIVKCKNWARDDRNPNYMECVFNVIKGSRVRQAISWALPAKHLKGK
jgi:hypothetical protein